MLDRICKNLGDEIPHVTQHDEADITEMETFRKSLRDLYTGEKISVTPLAFIIKAVVKALKIIQILTLL